MADKKISALPDATAPLDGTEVLPVVQGGTTDKVTVANLTVGRAVSALNIAVTGATIPANGVYLAAANSLALSTNTTERVRVNSSGNVGVGTNAPGFPLDVNGIVNSASEFRLGGYAFSRVAGVDGNGGFGGGYNFNMNNSTTAKVNSNGTSNGIYHAGDSLRFYADGSTTAGANATERMRITTTGNIRLGGGALATTATDGFPYIPTCPGVPTGVPTAITGFAPMVVDSTNNKLYVYVGGAWTAMN